MSSWSSAGSSRGKKLVALATTSEVLPVFSEDDVFLGAEYRYRDSINDDYKLKDISNNDVYQKSVNIKETIISDLELENSDSEFLEKETNGEKNEYLAFTTNKNNINIQESLNRIESMENDGNNNDHDDNGNKLMEINATEEIKEKETDVITENENEALEEIDPDETVETHTKKGENRRRKKYKHSKSVRTEIKKNNIISLHRVGPSCINCKFKCHSFFSVEDRTRTNQEFWKLNWKEKRTFVMNSTENKIPRRKVEGSKKNKTFTYFLKDASGAKRRVCKIFFLTTLGYKKTNDWIIHSVWANAKTKNQVQNNDSDRQGRHPPNKMSNTQIESHIDSFNPSVSYYRRVHAPNRLYLPSDLNVTLMFADFRKKYPDFICSYEKYRKVLKSKNISFAKLGNEECELCESYHMHNSEHTAESLNEDCEKCCSWKDHIEKAIESRNRYALNKENCNEDKDNLCVSVDLQKVIMLPRMEMFKKAIFSHRLIVYNESFVPVGKIRQFLPFAVLWHEAVSGRHQEDIISAFNAFFLQHRDVRNITLWLDNCSSQNKNWAFLSFLIYIVNSPGVAAETIHVNYFEPGHTFMSADSFHHQVEESLKRQKKTYDFADFENAVQSSNKGKVQIKSMQVNDFQLWKNLSSASKIKNRNPKFYIAKITELMVKRNEFEIYYKCKSDEEWKKLDFLLKKHIGEMPTPSIKTAPNGFEREKVDNLFKALGPIMPDNRKQFWKDLPEKVIV